MNVIVNAVQRNEESHLHSLFSFEVITSDVPVRTGAQNDNMFRN
jgi:hypothetical protein